MVTNLGRWVCKITSVGMLSAAALLLLLAAPHAHAAADTDFTIQVSPSPLTATLTPGHLQAAALTVRNLSTHTETLTAGLKGFAMNPRDQSITLNDDLPGDIAAWVSFDHPTLTLGAGQSQQLTVQFATPTDVGFSYAFAISLNRVGGDNTLAQPGTHIKASVAVFCLANINRSDATAGLAITGLTTNKPHYSFLPAQFSLTVKNTGNVISQPTGSIFIQRAYNSTTPITTLALNSNHSYILPGQSRTLTTQWTDGFPVYVTKTADGKTSVHLSWSWKHLNQFRVGRYVAKAVLVYNNGSSDVPVVSSVSFWVMPWWLLVCCLVLLVVLVMGLIGWGRLIFKGTSKVKGKVKGYVSRTPRTH